MRTIHVPLCRILDLASCADDYGFADDVLMYTLYEFVGDVTDAEIAAHAASVAAEPGYGPEDAEQITERLTEWRNTYRKVQP